jgi:hypothetical protein
MATDFLRDLVRSLSATRFSGYRHQAATDKDALCKYVWNTLLCESLCPGFQILEVSFRNAAHAEIFSVVGDPKWVTSEHGFLYEDERIAIQAGKRSVGGRGRAITEDLLIAEMKFGFWTSLLDARYDKLWHKIIQGVFPHMPRHIRTRGDASALMNTVRKLRNAALHHHSIWHWSDLEAQHAKMCTLIGYICKSSSVMLAEIDRFPKIYGGGPEMYEPIAAKMLSA